MWEGSQYFKFTLGVVLFGIMVGPQAAWTPILLLFLAYTTYQTFKLPPAHKYENNIMEGKVFGHRGCRHKDMPNIPENSMSAFGYARDQSKGDGCDGIELDTRLTKDGVAVVNHDGNVDRMFNGTGFLHEMEMKEVEELRFKCNLDEGIPKLEDVFKFCRENKLMLLAEVKEIHNARKMAQILVQLIKEYEMYETCSVISFYPNVLYHVRKIDPKVQTCILYARRHLGVNWGNKVEDFGLFGTFNSILDPILCFFSKNIAPSFLGCTWIGPHSILVTKEEMDSWRDNGFLTYTWVINSNEDKAYYLEQKIAIGTDYP